MSEAINTVVIDLFEANLPGTIDNQAFVQQALKERLISDIKSAVHSNKNAKPMDVVISEAGRQVFFIDGTRGAGKTTFMNEIVKSFEDSDTIYTLGCIDPTKLPQIEPILLTVIAKLNSSVTNAIKKASGWCADRNTKKDEWQRCLNSISRSIQLLGRKDYSTNYFDEALELNSLLGNAADGLGLVEQFSKLLNQACELLGCEAILVAFDDIDTQFNTGWSVLEAIRKYFNSPKLIVLMTGDLRLYSQLIRGKQYGNYDDIMLREEASETEKSNRSVMVNHLEQQYLIKLLPVHRRINLQSLYLLADDNKNQWPIKVVAHSGKNAIALKDAVCQMLEQGLYVREGSDLKLYADEILKQPVRLVIQLLQRYYLQRHATPRRSSTDIFNEAIRSTMLNSIYKAGLTYDSSDAHIGIIAKDIFNYTLMDGDTNTGFYLRPQSESEVLRSSAIYLASTVSKAAEGSFWRALYIMLVGCGSVSLYEKLVQDNPQKLTNEQIKQACRTYLGLGRSESLMNWANRSNAALCPVNQDSTRGVHPGLLRLNRSTPDSNSKSRKSVIGTEVYKSQKEKDYLARLSVDIASSDLAGKNMHSFISIPNLLGGIADLIEGAVNVERSEPDIGNLKKLLAKLAFRTTCSAPPWASSDKSAINQNDEDDIESDELNYGDAEGENTALKAISEWILLVKAVSAKIQPSSILLGKIWTRLYFNLTNISESHGINLGTPVNQKNTKSTQTNAAKIMRFNVVALLHAVLFEEDAYHHVSSKSLFTEIDERKNPVSTVDLFVNKLEKLLDPDNKSKKIDELPIFHLLITCPLLHPFLFADKSKNETTRVNTKEEKFTSLITQITKTTLKEYQPENHGLKHLYKASITASRAKGQQANSEKILDSDQ